MNGARDNEHKRAFEEPVGVPADFVPRISFTTLRQAKLHGR